MKKQKPFSLETQEEKEARWAKNLKAARAMARQAGIKVVKKKNSQTCSTTNMHTSLLSTWFTSFLPVTA